MSTSTVPPLTLHRGWLPDSHHVWSPFVVKLELRLRLANVPYTTAAGSPRSAPKGKIPYINHNGVQIGDSSLITKHLVAAGALPDLNARLSPEQRAYDLGLRALLEEKLYFYHAVERWVQNYYTMRDHALWNVPYPVRILVGNLVYAKVQWTLHGQGTGRHEPREIVEFKREIWETVEEMLKAVKMSKKSEGREPFWVLGGDGPSEADTTLFGFVVSVLVCEACPESGKLVREMPTVIEYAERIHEKYFPDYGKWRDEI